MTRYLFLLFCCSIGLHLQAATINVNYNNTNNAWTATAMTAFDEAISIWEETIFSASPIEIDAYYKDFSVTGIGSNSILGMARATVTGSNFSSTHAGYQANTSYVVALAEKMGATFSPWAEHPYHIKIYMNSSKNWVYSISYNPQPNHYDFISVALHEIGHGLGFVSIAVLDQTTSLPVYNASLPYVMDREIIRVNSGTTRLENQAGSGATTEAFLTSDQLFYDGTFAVTSNGSSKPQLYAPTTFIKGSSISHWDQGYFSTNDHDALMHPQAAISSNSFHRHIGDVTTGFMRDIGWDLWPTGISSLSVETTLHVYPNPSSENFYISSNKEFNYQIINILGGIVEENFNMDTSHKISLNQHPVGVYFLEAHIDDKTESLRLIKSR